MIKKIRLYLSLLLLPKEMKPLAKAIVTLAETLKKISDAQQVLTAAEDFNSRLKATVRPQPKEESNDPIH